MSSTSKQSEDDLLPEEVGDEGQGDKESLTVERNAVLPRASQQLKNQTATSLKEINLLTNAILGLTKSLPDLLTPPRGETKAKGNGRRASLQTLFPPKRQKTTTARWEAP